jgi:dTDP-4-amino-4,6-dideoxygalactose transaminase
MVVWNCWLNIKGLKMNAKIPFVDLLAQHEELRPEIDAAIKDVIDHSSFIGGDALTRFEEAFACYLGVSEVVGTSNGTDALWLAFYAAGVQRGEAVITVPNTFIASTEAIHRVGAHPLFVDIDLDTYNLSPLRLQEFLETRCYVADDGGVFYKESGARIAAILPVHLYGLPADMEAISTIARQYQLKVIEDACQAHGAGIQVDQGWRMAGTMGVASAFSFYPGKNLGAMGDAGAVATDDPEMAARMRWIRSHGSIEKYYHVTVEGWNSRLDAVQAAVLEIKLRRLDAWNQARIRSAELYRRALGQLPVDLPVVPDGMKHIYHLYVIRSAERDRLRNEMQSLGIETGIHYPVPLHLQKAYAWLGLSEGAFPNTELAARTILSLPMFPHLTDDQIEQVSAACTEILSRSRIYAD